MVVFNHLIIILLIILKSFVCPLTTVKMIVSLHPKARHNNMITIQITFEIDFQKIVGKDNGLSTSMRRMVRVSGG